MAPKDRSQAEVLAIIAKRQAAQEIASSGFAVEINRRIGQGETHREIAAVLAD